jgi:hypothetical protein
VNEIVCDRNPLRHCFWLQVTDGFLLIGRHLPFVRRMSFLDVDGPERCLVLIVVKDCIKALDRAPIRWSRVTAENKNERPSTHCLFKMEELPTLQLR